MYYLKIRISNEEPKEGWRNEATGEPLLQNEHLSTATVVERFEPSVFQHAQSPGAL